MNYEVVPVPRRHRSQTLWGRSSLPRPRQPKDGVPGDVGTKLGNISANRQQSEAFEAWLERVAQGGGQLIAVAPSQSAATMLSIFTVRARGDLAKSGPPQIHKAPSLRVP